MCVNWPWMGTAPGRLGAERRFCAPVHCWLARRSVRLWGEHAKPGTGNMCARVIIGLPLLAGSAVLLTIGAELFAENAAEAGRRVGVTALAVGLLVAGGRSLGTQQVERIIARYRLGLGRLLAARVMTSRHPRAGRIPGVPARREHRRGRHRAGAAL